MQRSDTDAGRRAGYWWFSLILGLVATGLLVLRAVTTHAHTDGFMLGMTAIEGIVAAYLMFLAGEQFGQRPRRRT